MVPRHVASAPRPLWLLDVRAGGVVAGTPVYRWSTEPIIVTTAAGDTVAYTAGLAEDLYVTTGGDAPRDASVSVTVHDGTDWPLFFARGLVLERAVCVLRRWHVGDVLESADVVLLGRVVSVAWGARGEGIDLVLSSETEPGAATAPSAVQKIDTTTWPKAGVADDKTQGLAYPRIYGSPGQATVVPSAASPALMLQKGAAAATFLLVSGHTTAHDIHVAGRAVNVRVWDYSASPPASEDRPVKTTTDLLGQTVDYVDFFGSALTFDVGREYWLGMYPDGGGLINRRRDGSIRTAGEVLADLATQLGEDVDHGRQEAENVYLSAYKLDFSVYTQTDVAGLLTELEGILPVRRVRSPRGVYWRALRWRSDGSGEVATVDVAVDRLSRVGRVTAPDFTPFWIFTALYGPVRGSQYYFQKTLAPETTDDTRVFASRRCALSKARFPAPPGVERRMDVTLPRVWDHATALLILRDLAAVHTLPRRRITYEGGTWLESLGDGTRVFLTDDTLSLDAAPAMVWATVRGPGVTTVTLELVDDPDAPGNRATV